MTGLWLLIPLMPLFAGLVLFAWPKRMERWLWLAVLPALLAAAWPPTPVHLSFLWPEAHWGNDAVTTRGWLAFTGALWGCATAFAAASLPHDKYRLRFWLFWMIALAGNLLLIIANDGLSFYVGFTLMSLSAYGLVVHLGGPKPRRAGRLYLQLAIVGEFAVFAGLVLRAHAAGGSVSFAQWQQVPLDNMTLWLLLLGFGIKIGYWPLHVWLPQAHPAAPAAASAVLSGAMLKAGVLGLWRFFPAGDPLLDLWADVAVIVGLFGAYYAVMIGVATVQPKATLAYSSVSQMGYFLVILALSWRHPEQASEIGVLLVLFAVHHGIAKGALFLAAGVVAEGRFRQKAWWLLMILPAVALAGLPITSGAAAKALLKESFGHSDFGNWLLWLKLASAGTMLLLFRALFLLWHKQQHAGDKVLSRALIVPWALLSLATVIVPWSWPLMREPLLHSLSLSTSWALLWPILLAAALTAISMTLGWKPPQALTRRHSSAIRYSLRLTRLVQRPPLPALEPPFSQARWRARERRWNRFWQSGSVTLTAWLIGLLLILGWVW
jgi:hydrogenase-4 component B